MGGRSEGSRFFRHGELPLVLLVLVAEQPRHAYQLLAKLEHLFSPAYEPSTGTVYPAVTALVDSGLVLARQEGRRRVYSITAKGRRLLDENGAVLAAVEARTGVRLTTAEIDRVIARFAAKVKAEATVDCELLEKELDRVAARLATHD